MPGEGQGALVVLGWRRYEPREPPVMMASLPSSGRAMVPPVRFVDGIL